MHCQFRGPVVIRISCAVEGPHPSKALMVAASSMPNVSSPESCKPIQGTNNGMDPPSTVRPEGSPLGQQTQGVSINPY